MTAFVDDQSRRRKRQTEINNVCSDEELSAALKRGPKDQERRKRGCESLLEFGTQYFPDALSKSVSRDHISMAEKIQACTDRGEMFAGAYPRGSGKSTWMKIGILRATLIHPSFYTLLIGATSPFAQKALRDLKHWLRFNDLLFEDYPEACAPIRHLAGSAARANGQHVNGEDTQPRWTGTFIQMATLKGAACSGNVIDVAGITGEIRGRQVARIDGHILRPRAVLLDDVQTRESAKSSVQTGDREQTINSDVRYAAGPNGAIGLMMACTVIYEDDLACRYLDRSKYPEWHGERSRMLLSEPENDELWQEYWDILSDDLRNDAGRERSTEFYRGNRDAMDAGAAVSWEDRFFPEKGELSGIQHAMNLKLSNPEAFASEYQNEPIVIQSDAALPESRQIQTRVNGLGRGVVPEDASTLTAFVDCSEDVLWWMVCAWTPTVDCHILDYGVWPKQRKPYVTLNDCDVTMQQVATADGLSNPSKQAALFHGLKLLKAALCDREWLSDDGESYRVSKFAVDAGWGQQTDTVYKFCRAAASIPSKGFGITAGRKPLEDAAKKRGERSGPGWRYRKADGRSQKQLQIDTNYHKTECFRSLVVNEGDPGGTWLFGKPHNTRPDKVTVDHRMLCDQLTAETRTLTEGQGRTVWEYHNVRKIDNHFLDCLVGCRALALLEGISPIGNIETTKRKAKRSLREIAAAKGLRTG